MTASATAFIRTFLAIAAGAVLAVFAFILLLDPYGVSPLRLPLPRAIMDINQRYMYPQIVRTKAFDSVVIGTSTSRLLDPRLLNSSFDGRFANLAMNAGTAWEQTELAKLYLRHNPSPRTVIIGLDHVWCNADRSIARITFRGFPEWMYDEKPWNDLPEVFNLKTLEIAGRLAAFHLGLMPERIRGDGYEVFTPPEETYDLARARFHIWRDRPGAVITPETPARVLSPADERAIDFPAIAWLDDLLAHLPAGTRRMLVYMPVHRAAQPTPGSFAAAQTALCMRRIDAVAARRNTPVIDFSIDSAVTRTDSNYWDPLHYRLPIADKIIRGMKAASETMKDDPDGLYRIRRAQ
jgi:hypothetical protein